MVKQGRRAIDWVFLPLAFAAKQAQGAFFWTFGALLETRAPHKPSMGRVLLATWTYVGWRMIEHEIHLQPGQPAIINAAWTAWLAMGEGMVFWVVGSKFAPFIAPGAAGTAGVTAIGTAIRDAIVPKAQGGTPPSDPKVKKALEQAASLGAFGGDSNE